MMERAAGAEPLLKEISYSIRWSPTQYAHGSHRARRHGVDGDFYDYAPFWRVPDARRIDVRQTLRNPFGEIYVRQAEQRSRIGVYVVADLSASMRFGAGMPKMRVLLSLLRTIALSAYRMGDAFGFIGCDEEVREEFFLPASRRRTHEADLLARLADFLPVGESARGLKGAAERLGLHRKLVFLVSDFHMSVADAEATLAGLMRHDIAPIVLRSGQEAAGMPNWGLVALRDLESGEARLSFMRPALRKALLAERREERRRLERLCLRYGRRPFWIEGGFDPDRLSEHLLFG